MTSAVVTSAVADLVAILDLEPIEVNLFRGRSPQQGWQRVFGGQVIGQALVAACRTVEDLAERPPHSLHAYFLLGGDPKVPIVYEVDRIRDGKGARGFSRGLIFTRDGLLVASVAQEGLVRERREGKP
jgi:acyl-CoA thioesterase